MILVTVHESLVSTTADVMNGDFFDDDDDDDEVVADLL